MVVTLDAWKTEYIPAVAKLADNPKIAVNLRDGFPQPYTLDDASAYVTDCIAKGDKNQLTRAILADGQVVGSIGIFLREDGAAELGYWLGEPHWGRGIMTQAAAMLCVEAFSRFPVSRVFATPYAYNTGSRRVLEKSGFRFEGITECSGCSKGEICMYVQYRPEA